MSVESIVQSSVDPSSILQAKDLLYKKSKAYFIFKRTFDIILSSVSILALSPAFLIIPVLIKMNSRGPVIFAQPRVGKGKKVFIMYKFRSMSSDAGERLEKLRNLNEKDGPIFKIKKDPRITGIGRVLRKTSLDELPQLFNVLKGDMSIVGPRPPLLKEVKQYSAYEMQRLSVTPGLTCYWQVSGRSDIPFKEWIDLDLKYIKDCGLTTDLKIILKTFPAVISGKGAY